MRGGSRRRLGIDVDHFTQERRVRLRVFGRKIDGRDLRRLVVLTLQAEDESEVLAHLGVLRADNGCAPQKLLTAVGLTGHRISQRQIIEHGRMFRIERLRPLVEADRLTIVAFLGERRAAREHDAPIRVRGIVGNIE